MSYVPGYPFDVFISYSHANNHAGWISNFRQKLDARLKERVPPGATFFRDTDSLQGNDDLTPEVLEGVRGSAVLVIIVSRSYVTRPWCLKECKAFLEANAQRGIKGRIFPIRYDDISPSEYQQLIGEKLGYEFFGKTSDGKYNDVLDPKSGLFKTRMTELREELGAKLEEMKAQAASQAAPEDRYEVDPMRPIVFLAAPSPGLTEATDQMAAWLTGLKYQVIQPGERFYDVGDFESAYNASLGRSTAFVQLLGRRFLPRDDVQTWDEWQFLQAQNAGIPTLRWFNKYDQEGKLIDLGKLDADHRAFVTQNGVWDCDPHRFREVVRSEIEMRFHDRQQDKRVSGEGGAQPLIVMRADRSDRAFADSIGEHLRSLDCDWMRIPDRDVTSMEEFATQCAANGLLVIYRACPGRWVLSRLQELRSFLKTDFGRRWACGLWRAPEDEDDALTCSVDGMFVIERGAPQHLQDFVMAVRHRL